ncbi:protein of unknown function [Algoriphagus faecimaris]|uniref:DUF4221 domain-containing protein n=1 Tax=Algoriphagus faecimaris TaxID=686796 RepID=A0A1G6NB15_9BACT|nr:DUF4221 family protein [Algoriphagus faecimaris]SDC65010.1 protein of unknown function [Algoriphagus faecimaris]
MKIKFLLPLLLLLWSCGESDQGKEGQVSAQINVSLDTVMVDAGDEFLFLQDNLFNSQLTADDHYLVNYNRKDGIAEWIDLDELKLKKVLQFEMDGPNAIPPYTSGFLIEEDENIFFWNYRFYKIFDQKGQLVKDLELEKLAPELLGGSDAYPSRFYLDPKNSNRLLGHFVKWEDKTYFMLDIDLEAGSITEMNLPLFEKTQVYNTDIMYDGRWMGSYGPGIYPASTSDKVILATNVLNEVQVFDLVTDSLYTKSWDTPLLGSKRTYLPPKEADGQTGEIEEIRKLAEQDISYGRLVWDKEDRQFYRFSTKSYFGEEKDEYGSYVVTRADVFLSVFDEDLELIAEALIPEMNSVPKRHFVKDGKIWVYINMEDELGFVSVEVDF